MLMPKKKMKHPFKDKVREKPQTDVRGVDLAYAFNFYYSMGSRRSYKKVAEMFNVDVALVKQWASDLNWRMRVTETDMDMRRKVNNELMGELQSIKVKYKRMILNLLDTAFDDILEGDLKVSSIADLERIVKLNLLIDGEATERRETTILSQTEDEYKNLSRAELENILEAEYEQEPLECEERDSISAPSEGLPPGVYEKDAS
tara:strand:- start:451 stop:1059 length:609 start_codon:yes stop_codon:yes gene_type:complete